MPKEKAEHLVDMLMNLEKVESVKDLVEAMTF